MSAPRKTLEYHAEQGTRPNTTERSPSELVSGRARPRRDLKAEARQHFKRVSKLLGQREHETSGDAELLTLYSEVYLDYLEARAIVEREGRMVTDVVLTSHGSPVEKRKLHPMLKEIARCQSQLAALLRDLGLTVVSRDRPKKPLSPPPPVQQLTEEQRKNLTLGERAALGDESAIKILEGATPWTAI